MPNEVVINIPMRQFSGSDPAHAAGHGVDPPGDRAQNHAPRGGHADPGMKKAPIPNGPGLLSGDRSGAGQASTYTIHDTPKRSATMPKLGEKNVLANGIFTCPPSLRAPKSRSASASLGAVSDSAKP